MSLPAHFCVYYEKGMTGLKMMKNLPFTALRTLESVVRLHGFGRAAEELNVTQSAVSQQIRALEDWTGHKLLFRGSGKTMPTDVGLRLAAAVLQGFGVVETVCDDLRDRRMDAKRGLALASPPGFGYIWLLPRLINFDERFPETPVSLSTDVYLQDCNANQADVMIYYGLGGFPGLHAELLMQEAISPVCAPEVAKTLGSIADLEHHTILRDALQNVGSPPSWEFWAEEAGFTLPQLPLSRQFGQANMVIQAAIQGLGVAMGRGPLVADAIAQGLLVCPFENVVASQFSYWLVCRHDALKSQKVRLFCEWLHEQTAAQDAESLRGNTVPTH